jgi:hypothetical protein
VFSLVFFVLFVLGLCVLATHRRNGKASQKNDRDDSESHCANFLGGGGTDCGPLPVRLIAAEVSTAKWGFATRKLTLLRIGAWLGEAKLSNFSSRE